MRRPDETGEPQVDGLDGAKAPRAEAWTARAGARIEHPTKVSGQWTPGLSATLEPPALSHFEALTAGGPGTSSSHVAALSPYTPRSVLVTGGAGFIASHVVDALVQGFPDARVVVYDKLDECATMHNLDDAARSPHFEFQKGDLRNIDLLGRVLGEAGIDTVMHFAAQSHVDQSFGDSMAFTLNNVVGTHSLLEACRRYGQVQRFVNVSTDEVYGESSLGCEQGLDEHDTIQPTNPYAASKAGAELMAKAYATSFGLPVITTRGNNVYGPRQFPEKLVPKFILRASMGESLPIHGDGQALRSFLYVEDVASAMMAVVTRGTVGETYNIGTQRERRVVDVARDVCTLFGRDAKSTLQHVRDRAFNDRRYFISDSKMRTLGWQEQTSWPEGLQATKRWYMAHGRASYWDRGSLAKALKPHPTDADRPHPTHPASGLNVGALRPPAASGPRHAPPPERPRSASASRSCHQDGTPEAAAKGGTMVTTARARGETAAPEMTDTFDREARGLGRCWPVPASRIEAMGKTCPPGVLARRRGNIHP